MTPPPFAREHAVTIKQSKTGRWQGRCPLCKALMVGLTTIGLMDALCDHMNDHHWSPPKGNA